MGFTPAAPMLWATLHSNKSCGNPWTFSHVCGRLGIPTTFLFWLALYRKKEAVQSQFPHFVVEQHGMSKYAITQACVKAGMNKES